MNIEQRISQLEQLVAELSQRVDALTAPVSKGRAGRLPQSWAATPAMIEWAKEKYPNVDATKEDEKFRDYWLGRGATHVDWPATWRTWIRRANETAPSGRAALQRGPASRTAAVDEANRERINGALDKLAALRLTST